MRLTAVIVLLLALSARGSAQAVPVLRVGERLTYDARYDGPLFVSGGGRGVMEVVGIDTVRGREAYHVQFSVDGGVMWYHIHDRYESWIDRERFISLRFWQDITETNQRRSRHYEIYPERKVFVENTKPERPSVADPLDDASLLYAVRTMRFDSGARYDLPRYFIPDRNPVTIIVKRRDSLTVGAGKFSAVVVQPLIKSRGIFAEGGRAEMWFSDDENRYLLKLTAHLSIGSLVLTLKTIEMPPE
jgi:uncharacterized protein DUF3108